jgi:tRNA threonylcarbamoyladenosine biosynthesis protein TsaB
MLQTVLSIECSSELCSVALSYNGKLTHKSKHAPREHAYLVLPFTKALLEERRIGFSSIDYICFGQGPGAFTGLRVAASIAQGLALAHDIPLLSGCSLETLAVQATQAYDSPFNDFQIVSVLDARMSELYWASYKYVENETLHIVQKATLSSAQVLIDSIKTPTFFVGPGCRHLEDHLSRENCLNLDVIIEWQEKFPQASDLLISAVKSLPTNRKLNKPSQIPMPVYLRNNVAAKAKKPLV